ncbi:MotA/TolQ/ExbB proton channel family protein [Thalassospira sp.]|uniref:MotA/TolQ/ExbB proton channel family protein n=1 Tax=Thalassospira sp. TaxID=1912094 RepID=UPI0027327829|nr:MotA/TolQ/ExbB proton channel family protein [Thalassospira sp.]MDP2700177.1 MotA/TolQ/ExbB proton channel family protein [Thalassospira sp.]
MPETILPSASDLTSGSGTGLETLAQSSVNDPDMIPLASDTLNPAAGVLGDGGASVSSGWMPDAITTLPLYDLIDRAGIVGWVLSALALIGVMLFFYKLVGFLRRGLFADGFVPALESHLVNDDAVQAQKLLSSRRHPAARIGLFALSLPVGDGDNREAASDLIAARARKEIDGLNGGLRIMSAIAVLSPLLGLLGTVMGMINAFQQMEGAGSRIDPSVLSGGIWLALLTTAIGLVVAIPATALHMWMQSMINRAAGVMEDVCTLVVNRAELAEQTVPGVVNITKLRHAAE